MNVIVCGSRDFKNFIFLKEKLDRLFSKLKTPPVILSGGSEGADRLGERYAFERRLTYKVFHIGYKKGRDAFVRLVEVDKMVKEANTTILFLSKTKEEFSGHIGQIMNKSKEKGIKVKIIMV